MWVGIDTKFLITYRTYSLAASEISLRLRFFLVTMVVLLLVVLMVVVVVVAAGEGSESLALRRSQLDILQQVKSTREKDTKNLW